MRLERVLFMIGLLAGLALWAAFPALAEEEAASKALKLEDIHVKGQGMSRQDLPTTVNVVESEKFEEHTGSRVEEVLNDVPGVHISNYNQAGVGNLIQMRGFNKGGHGGDVAVTVDGIPLNEGESHADGYADLNVLIPLEIERMEVYKGPSSALFGNFGRGGALAFYSKRDGEYNKMKMDYGSFGTYDVQGAFGHRLNDSWRNNTALEIYHTDGYQDHSDWSRQTFSTRFSYDASDKFDMSFSVRAHHSEWNSPGYIPQSQFNNVDASRRQAINAQDDGGNKQFFTERAELGYNISKDLRLLYWAYGTQQDFTRFAKFGYDVGGQTEKHHDRNVGGTGTSLNLDTKLADKRLTGVVGVEVYDEVTDTLVWNTENRVRLNQTQNRRFDIATYSAFGQTQYEWSRYFRPWVGVRYDTFGGSYENHDPGTTSYSNDMNNFKQFSPKVGFRSEILDHLDFRASYCEGFALPEAEAKFDPNIKVEAMQLKQYEVGLNYALSKKLWVDVAYFILDTDNEIQEDPPGSGEYRNVGKTRHKGLESGLKVCPIPGLEFFANLTLYDSEVLDNPDPTLVGKQVTSVPDYLSVVGAQYTFPSSLGGRLQWRSIGKYYLDGANTTSYDGYNVVDARVFYTIPGDPGQRKYKVTLGVDNIFDEHYSDSVFSGFGTINYAVTNPRTYWVGLTLEW